MKLIAACELVVIALLGGICVRLLQDNTCLMEAVNAYEVALDLTKKQNLDKTLYAVMMSPTLRQHDAGIQ